MEPDDKKKVIGEYTGKFFTLLELEGNEKVVEWCMKAGLISPKYTCPKCGENMKLKKKKGSFDGLEWRCRIEKEIGGSIRHDICRSLRNGSFFSHSHLSLCDILRITRYWFGRCFHQFVMNEVRIQNHTVVDWFTFFREICMIDVIDKSTRIGGDGVIVELAEFEFGNMKYGKGKPANACWVFGGVERGSSKCFFRTVEVANKESLLSVVKEWILPGSTIISACWRVYDCISSDAFIDLSIIHGLIYKDIEVGGRTSSINTVWSKINRYLKANTNHVEGHFDSYLAEYMWRKMHNHSMNDKTFKEFLDAVSTIYAASGEDGH